MKKLEKLLKKEEKKLWSKWFKSKDKEVEDQLFDFYRMWAEELYDKVLYRSTSDSYYEEFLPNIYTGLVKSIRSFRKDGGASFKTFATSVIRNELYAAWRPFFKDGRQRPGTFNFVGDILSNENFALRDRRVYYDNSEAKEIIKETVAKLKLYVVDWGYAKKEWKVFYYRVFKFMPIKEIQERVKLSEWKIMITLSHIKKDILDEFGDEYKELLKGKYDD